MAVNLLQVNLRKNSQINCNKESSKVKKINQKINNKKNNNKKISQKPVKFIKKLVFISNNKIKVITF